MRCDSVSDEIFRNISGEGPAEFFDIDASGLSGHGTYTAPFPGIQGWYWLNLSEDEPVTLTLRSSGFYTYAAESPGGRTHQLEDVTSVAVDSSEPGSSGGVPALLSLSFVIRTHRRHPVLTPGNMDDGTRGPA